MDEPLSYPYIIKKNILNELARVFYNRTNARILLTEIGYPVALPEFNDPIEFWDAVCQSIDVGVMEQGFERLLEAARQRFPGNQVFRNYGHRSDVAPPPNRTSQAVNIVISGWEDPITLLEAARRLAQHQNRPPDSISLGFANVEGVLISLADWTPEQAINLQRAIEAEAQANNVAIDTSVGTSEFRDYLLSRLYIEGPDQARYEINDVRASTPIGEIAKEVITEFYDPEIFGKDKHGRGREVVVDKQNEDGSTQRLNPNETLHGQNIQDGDTLSVAPQATAGSVNPADWEAAVVKVKNEILHYRESHPGFQVLVNLANLPTEYVIKFSTPSYGAPPGTGKEPVPVSDHEIFLVIPPGFPLKPPRAYWQTNIFHPNIHPENGYVCMGDLSDHWTPGTDFYNICQQLVDMAKFDNYSLNECYNQEALNWVRSPEGVLAIEKIGGQHLINQLYRLMVKPRKLQIVKI